MKLKIGPNGIAVIKRFESLHDGDLSVIGLQPKMCPAGVWTEGWGHAIIYKGQQLKGAENKTLAYQLASVKTEEEAGELLQKDLISREDAVNELVKVRLNQNQFDALVSFVYNIGEGNFETSSVLKWINLGDYKAAAKSFRFWNKAGGKVYLGLTRRRAAEKELFEMAVMDLKPTFEWIDKHTQPRPVEIIKS